MKKAFNKSAAIVSAAAIMLTMAPYAEFIGSMSASAATVPEGFVYTEGTKFMCDDAPYYYGGTNCYYLTFKSKYAVDSVLNDCENNGLNVIRIWGNIDAGTRVSEASNGEYAKFVNSADGSGEKDGVYFQYFDKELNRPVINEGADGLRHLDYVIQQAEKKNLKLIITFTNYWEAFGGMDQYIKWCNEAGLGNNLNRDDFYTNETCKKWYKDYINGLLNHTNYYTGEKLKDSEAVFAWELANEPRCEKNDAYCKNDILYNWAKEMSAYVKSVDPYHMVAVGDEGFYNFDRQSEPYKSTVDSDYAFSGNPGVDFDKLISIDTIDFGTPHFYCDSWSLKIDGVGKNGGDDDMDWLKLHAQSAQKANKPVILEEFGLKDRATRDSKYQSWMDLITDNEEYEFQGFNYWMIASWIDDAKQASFGDGKYYYTDYDQYTVYGPAELEAAVGTPEARNILLKAAAKMAAKNKTNYFSPSTADYDIAKGGNLKLNLYVQKGSFNSLTLGGKTLSSSSDYTYTSKGTNSNGVETIEITIKESVLKNLDPSNYTLKANMSAGANPQCTISVDNSSIKSAVVTLNTTEVDKNSKYPTSLSAQMTLNGNTLKGILLNGTQLVSGTDYTVSGNTIKFTTSFIKKLSDDSATLTFDFSPCKDVDVELSVKDTTGNDVIDDFESYESSDDLWSSYSRNQGGNDVSLSTVTKNGSKVLAFGYKIDDPNYCGVMKSIGTKDMSAYEGISLWVQGDNSNNNITVQFKDANGNYWESYVTLDSSSGKTVNLPFSQFVQPSWQSAGAAMDTSKLTEFAIYAGGSTSVKSGTVYLDNICGYVSTPDVIDIASCDITVSTPNVFFRGTRIKPVVTIMKNGDVVPSSEYTLSYTNNLSVGTGKITIKGKNNFTGTTVKTFNITQRSVKNCDISIDSAVFTGSRVKPEVTVNCNGTKLYSGNYTIAYSNNLSAGTATVTITGKNNLKDKVTKTFKISARDINSCNVVISKNASNSSKPNVKVMYNGSEIYKGNYTVSYSTVSNGKVKVTVKGKNNLSGTFTKDYTI